jgi:hypothetical protein
VWGAWTFALRSELVAITPSSARAIALARGNLNGVGILFRPSWISGRTRSPGGQAVRLVRRRCADHRTFCAKRIEAERLGAPAWEKLKREEYLKYLVTGANFRAPCVALGWRGADKFGEGRDLGAGDAEASP